jgi:hypothetical protein
VRGGFAEVFLNRRGQIWLVVMAGGILALGLAGCTRQGVTPNANAETPPQQVSGRIKNMWVSQTTGKQFSVTVEGDVFRAQWLNVPSEWAAHGAFMRTECKHQGSQWIGTTSSYMPWTSQKGPDAKVENWCHLETKFEVDSMTANSISGRGENAMKFDAQKCKILESSMADFQWSPEP